MAFGQLSLATGNQEYADIAKKTFDIVLSKVDNPKGKWNKLHPGTRDLKGFALPMILCNLALEIEHLLDEDFFGGNNGYVHPRGDGGVLASGTWRTYC